MIRVDLGKRQCVAAMWAILVAALAPSVCGQAVAVAEVDGQVADPSGATVSGAEVKITQSQTKFSRIVMTDAQGNFRLLELPVGPCVLEVKAEGFKTYMRSGIILQVGAAIQLNVSLTLGSVNESVEVNASASMVEAKSNAVAQVIDERRINDLPLNGRQPTQLIMISGAAMPSVAGNHFASSKNYNSSTAISVAGGQGNYTNYLLDGGDNNDTFTNVNLPFPFPDALQEFSVETSSLPARNGMHPGAAVNMVTKSGTNTLHGDLFEFVRNGDVNARNFFAPVHDSLKRNQYGGTAGGKILRDRLFFFGGYQGTRNRQDPPSTTSFIPTAAALQGDFSALESAGCQSSGKPRTIIDPMTGQAFPNAQVPVTRFDPAAVKLMAYLPVASADKCGRVNYGIPTTGDEDQFIGRVDWIQNMKHSLFGRYFVADYRNPAVWVPGNALVTQNAGNLERAQTFTLGDSYIFGPSTLNTFHATFSRARNDRSESPQDINPTTLGINSFAFEQHYLEVLVNSDFNVGCTKCRPGFFNTNTFQFADDVDLVRGRHQMAFGVDLLRSQNNLLNAYYDNGQFQFNGQYSNDALLDFLLGDMSYFEQGLPQPNTVRQTNVGLYAQDTIKVSKRLTVNVGLRWEPMLFPQDLYGRGSVFSLSAFLANQHSAVYPNAPAGMFYYGDPGVNKSFTKDKLTNLSPRLGVVWSPRGDGRETIRAGAAILYDTPEAYFAKQVASNPPFGREIAQTPALGTLSNPWAGYPGGNPFPGAFPPPANAPFPLNALYVTMPPLKPTYMTQWNVSYQRQFGKDWLASASYLGNKTTHMWLQFDYNPAIYIPGTCNGKPCSTTANTTARRLLTLENPSQGPYIGNFYIPDDGANATYNALILSLQHRYSAGFTLLANYTLSHCIDDGDFNGDVGQAQYQNQNNRRADRGDCNFDSRNIFNLSAVALSPVRGNTFQGHIFGNWKLAPLFHASTGVPVNVIVNKDISLTGDLLDRPNLISSQIYPASIGPTLQWVNPAAFAPAATGTFGNLGRDAVRAPGIFNVDVALSRLFSLSERFKLEVRAEAFNVLNHTNLGAPNVTTTSSSFGRITTAADPRIFQFATKLYF